MAPTLETPRLRLRAHSINDFPACAALWADPAVTRFISGRPHTIEESWARLMRYAGHWTLLGYGFWAVEEKEHGTFIGELGFAEFKREIQPPIDVPEAGWAFVPSAHGKGYAAEALSAALQWFDRTTACIIHPENARSIRLAERSGYLRERTTTYKGQAALVYRR